MNLGFDEAAAFEHENTTAIFIIRHTHTRALWVQDRDARLGLGWAQKLDSGTGSGTDLETGTGLA